VNAAFDRLSSIMQKLEFFKGDKTALKAFIDKVSGLEAAKYTEATWTTFNDALTAAASVYEDENATQVEVDNAKAELEKVMADLQTVTVDNTIKAPVNNGDTTVSVKTGDESLVGMFAGIALLSVAGYALLRRKFK
ncbi:FIVAR domain-containing protein, partial [Thomasclavelia sp.]|uniref:FIVAR domain-containing protein n=1 Tax=Thomasclavelia sp. TaxID=3025757 RepID=UPI00261B8471